MDLQNSTNIPEVMETIVVLRNLNADETVRKQAFYREKRLHDEATALNGAREEGREEGRQKGILQGIEQEKSSTIEKLKRIGMSDEDISLFQSM